MYVYGLCPAMAIETPFCYHDAQRRSSSSASPAAHITSSSSSLDINMRTANSPSASASSTCSLPPSSCTNSHETIVSIDRAGMVRSASFRPSRGVTPTEHTPTVSAMAGTLPTAVIPPSVPAARSSPALGAGAPTNTRRLSLLSTGFWVSVELFLTLSQILAAIVVLAVSQNKRPETPLPVWVVGYAVGCSATLPLLYWRYYHHPSMDTFLEPGGNASQHHHHHHHHHHLHQQSSIPWPPSASMPISYPSVGHIDPHDPIGSRVYPGVTRVRVELCMERLRMTLDCFFAVWFVLGNVWVFGRPSAAQESPKLYRLCVVFLGLSCVSYAMPFVVCAAVCCCLPCLISLLGFGEGSVGQGEGRGASADTIAALPIFRFRSKRSTTKQLEKGLPLFNDAASDSDCSSEGGVMGAGTQHERIIAGDDAACCICLGRYRDNAQLRGLPCSHHFHVECLDQWLKINASCPLCKFSLQGIKNGDGDGDTSSTAGRRGRRLFEEV